MSCADIPAQARTWDLTAVLDLIHSLSTPDGEDRHYGSDTSITPSLAFSDSSDQLPSIETNTTSLSLGNFDKLWSYLGSPPLYASPLNVSTVSVVNECEAVLKAVSANDGKTVGWQDQVVAEMPSTIVQLLPLPLQLDLTELTKSQRKKARRRERKAAQGPVVPLPLASSPSDRYSEHERRVLRRSKERRNLIQQLVHDSPTKKKVQEALPSPHDRFLQDCQKHKIANRSSKALSLTLPSPSTHFMTLRSSRAAKLEPQSLLQSFTKKAELLSLLYSRFEADWSTLHGLNFIHQVPSDQIIHPNGIHVFVDSSNIFIGFHDAIKVSKGLSKWTRMSRQRLNFYNLSLILERGRPAAKRVLAGSDNYESIQEAAKIGYELNILERVSKAKEGTARQKQLQGLSGASSGSDTNNQAPMKQVEQGVDEILHLKILESVLDAEAPSTIVLATGDAAEAEYSQGFLKMVERALVKKWKVEVVAWKANISSAYKKRSWRERWGDAFRVIELDDFLQVLRADM